MNRDRIGIISLVVMLVADVLLIAWIFARPTGTDQVAPARQAASPATASPSTSEPEARQPRYLATAVGDTLWRATVAACTGSPSVVGRSEDGGRTWKKVDYDGQVVYRLRFTDPAVGFVVGADRGCAETVVRSTGNSGEDWQESPADQTWGALGAKVLVPGGREVEACGSETVESLATVDEARAYVACGDGRVRRTTSGGSSWEDVTTAEGVSSLAASGDRLAVASAADGCDGLAVALASVEDGELGEATCVKGAEGAAVVLDGGTGWLVGDKAWRSEDLTSWEPLG